MGSGSSHVWFGRIDAFHSHTALAGLNEVTQQHLQTLATNVSNAGCALHSCNIWPDFVVYRNDTSPPIPWHYHRTIVCEWSCPQPDGSRRTDGGAITNLQTIGAPDGAPGVVYYGCENSIVVRLSNDTSPPTSGDLAEVEPGNATTTLRATVYDSNNQPVPNVNIKLEVTVEANSGGHGHDNNRPKGLLDNGYVGTVVEGSSGNSGMPFTFIAPAPAGDHKIKATCTGGRTCNQEGPDKVWVGVKGLKQQAGSSNYVLLPNRDANHPGNHYVTPNTEGKTAYIAAAYRKKFPSDPVLHFNDASLVRGGLFDISSNWQFPHETHQLGRNVDVKANEFYHEPSQSIPSWNYIDFWNMGVDFGCYVALHSGATPNEHFHLHCP